MTSSCAIAQFKGWDLDPAVAQLIASTCFGAFTRLTNFRCNNSFLTAAIKRWDQGKFDFNGLPLYLGLEDIYNITGLPVDGSPIVCDNFEPGRLIMDMLGDDDPARGTNIYYVKKSWLKARFERLRVEESNKEWVMKYARAYLLFFMGTLLFPENHKATVFVGYLLFLKDLTAEVVNSFAWGTAVLAKLQDGFEKGTSSIGASWILEMFLLERIPLLRKDYLRISNYETTTSVLFPSFVHWSEMLKNVSTNMHHMHLKVNWKNLLNQIQSIKDVNISWQPYRRFGSENQRIFYSSFHIFDINIVNLHQPQLSPNQLNIREVDISAIMKVRCKQKSLRGHSNWNLLQKYAKGIKFWNEYRYNSVVQGEGGFVLPPIPQPRGETVIRSEEWHEEDNEFYDAIERDDGDVSQIGEDQWHFSPQTLQEDDEYYDAIDRDDGDVSQIGEEWHLSRQTEHNEDFSSHVPENDKDEHFASDNLERQKRQKR